jgi:putative nucleotidyltransferase with HDIG domain
VVGVLRNKEDAKTIKAGLEEILFEKQIKIKIKLGILELEPNTDLRHILHFLIESLGKSHEETVFFIKDQLPLQTYGKMKPDSSLSSLYLDAEEKNIELLRFVKELKEAEKKTEEAYFQLISSLIAALESKDPYTKGHSQRVCDYAFMLAVNLNLSEEEKEVIRKAALLHDLGKIGIPDSILHKKGKLTEEEFSVIKEHEIFSAKILEPIKEFKDVIPSILHHHENFDGSGYPHGLAADFIPLGARIIAISDIFDALTTGRDYKYAMSIAEAVKELNNIKGKKLDPHLVDSFIEALKELNLFHP